MPLNLFDRVALRTAVPGRDLHPGDVATLVDFVPHPGGGEQGCVLEFFNAMGESMGVVTVPASAVEPLRIKACNAVSVARSRAISKQPLVSRSSR